MERFTSAISDISLTSLVRGDHGKTKRPIWCSSRCWVRRIGISRRIHCEYDIHMSAQMLALDFDDFVLVRLTCMAG